MKLDKSRRYIFGNWKMSQSLSAGESFFSGLPEEQNPKVERCIFPSFHHLLSLQKLAQEKQIHLGAQDCSDEESGAFTGEVSAKSLQELGISYVLIGHSERRQRFSESNEYLKRKLDRVLEANLTPVFCLGENLDQRKAGQVETVLDHQLEAIKSFSEILIAYEPVWAIGTGLVASPLQIQEAHAFLAAQKPKCPLLYGGSVKPENAAEILKIPNVEGLLIGGASLKPESFSEISRFALES